MRSRKKGARVRQTALQWVPHRDAVGDLYSTDEGPNRSQHGHCHSVCCAVRDCSSLVIVAMNLGKVPIYNSDSTVKLDQYARAKDIFALVLPFLTTVAGFWPGSQGTVQAQRQAADATAVARKAQEQRSAILSVAPPMRDGTDLLTAAKAAHPAAWDLPVNPPERSHVAGQHFS